VRVGYRDPNIGMLEKSRAVQLLRTCAWSEVSKKRRTTEEGGAKDDRASRPGLWPPFSSAPPITDF
jgi:hypothetical protein